MPVALTCQPCPGPTDAVCDADCRVLVLDHPALDRMEAEAPGVRATLYAALALEVAIRLRATDRLVRESQ